MTAEPTSHFSINASDVALYYVVAIIKRGEELLKARKPDIYKPPHINYMVEQKVKILDRIIVSDTDPSLSSVSLAEMASLKNVKEKTETNFTIVTRNSDDERCYHEEDVIKVNILSPAGDQLETEIKDSKDGKYTVTYTPQCVGQHRVEIQVSGQPLTGSPWIVQVIPHQYQFAFQFGSEEKEQGQFNSPGCIAVNDKTRTLAVADYSNRRIQMFSFEGNFLREITLKGNSRSLAFTGAGDLLVRDNSVNKILLFTENGQFISYMGGEHVKDPWYVSVISDGRIIISDSSDKRIKVLTGDRKDLLQSFKAPDCNLTPCCVVYHQDKFFVSFSFADRLMVFKTTQGSIYMTLAAKDLVTGSLGNPLV